MVEQIIAAYVTMYGFPDNDPPYSATIAHPVLHQQAGGTGRLIPLTQGRL